MKTVKFLHYDLVLIPTEQDRFNNFNWFNFKTGEKVYLDDNEIGFFEKLDKEGNVFICIQ